MFGFAFITVLMRTTFLGNAHEEYIRDKLAAVIEKVYTYEVGNCSSNNDEFFVGERTAL